MTSFGSSEVITNKVAIKFLLPNGITGSLIGSGGSAIKELVRETTTIVAEHPWFMNLCWYHVSHWLPILRDEGNPSFDENFWHFNFFLSNELILGRKHSHFFSYQMEITGAKVHVSSADEVYPGTNDRIVLISGSDSSVSSAQALIWQLLSQNFRAIEAVRFFCPSIRFEFSCL